MNINSDLELFNLAKRNYNILQIFTYITAALIIATIYIYSKHELAVYQNYVYYSYLIMGFISLYLGFMFNRKIRDNRQLVEGLLQRNPSSLDKFKSNKAIQIWLNVILIIILVATFLVNGIRLDILNDIFFILVIFSCWLYSKNYYIMFKSFLN